MSPLNVLLPLASATLCLVFAGLLLDQWLQRRRSFHLVWAAGLIFYAVGSGSEFIGGAFGWNGALYRAWYLGGALFTAAYLGMGTVYLLRRSRFGYFAAVAVLLGGVLALALVRRYPGSATTAYSVAAATILAAMAGIIVTARHREQTANLFMAVLGGGSIVVAFLVITAPVAGPGYALDAATQVPVGTAMPGYIRVLSGPFNVAGAASLVFGAIFSLYVFMPKRKLLRSRALPPVLAQVYGVVAITVNLVASLPTATAALFGRRLNSRVPATLLIAFGGFVPSVTSGLDRFGITWTFFAGEFVGVLLIFAGFLVSEEVFANLRIPGLGATLWTRRKPAVPGDAR